LLYSCHKQPDRIHRGAEEKGFEVLKGYVSTKNCQEIWFQINLTKWGIYNSQATCGHKNRERTFLPCEFVLELWVTTALWHFLAAIGGKGSFLPFTIWFKWGCYLRCHCETWWLVISSRFFLHCIAHRLAQTQSYCSFYSLFSRINSEGAIRNCYPVDPLPLWHEELNASVFIQWAYEVMLPVMEFYIYLDATEKDTPFRLKNSLKQIPILRKLSNTWKHPRGPQSIEPVKYMDCVQLTG
jgi:hypothetical protein